jgi:hypothetical protein
MSIVLVLSLIIEFHICYLVPLFILFFVLIICFTVLNMIQKLACYFCVNPCLLFMNGVFYFIPIWTGAESIAKFEIDLLCFELLSGTRKYVLTNLSKGCTLLWFDCFKSSSHQRYIIMVLETCWFLKLGYIIDCFNEKSKSIEFVLYGGVIKWEDKLCNFYWVAVAVNNCIPNNNIIVESFVWYA